MGKNVDYSYSNEFPVHPVLLVERTVALRGSIRWMTRLDTNTNELLTEVEKASCGRDMKMPLGAHK
jgi:hypothetical protein